MTKTLLFAPFANWTLHFETDMELAQRAIDNNEKLTIVYCDGSLPVCEPNPKKVSLMCKMCMARRDNGFRWLDKTAISFIPLNLNNFKLSSDIEKLVDSMETVEQVRDFVLEDSDVGMSAVSSTVSFFREPKLNWKEHGDVLRKHLRTAVSIHYRLKEILRSSKYDKIILFNGRYSTFRPLLRLSQKNGIDLSVHERGADFTRFSLTKNTYPHDIEYIEEEIISFANDKTSLEEKKRLGNEWFVERQENKIQGWKVYTESQKYGSLPAGFDEKNFNIAIFNSSEDEFVAIEEWKNPYYKNQNSGVEKILEGFKNTNICFFLRMHPNLREIDNSQVHEIKKLEKKYTNLTVIPADSHVSTYDLMRKADMVLTFGSTAGIEASYLGKPSIVMGKSPYLILNTCIQPISHEAMIDIVLSYRENGVLPETEKHDYLFGYYMKKYGEPYKYVRQKGISFALLEKDGEVTNLSKSTKIYMIWVLRAFRKLFNLIKGNR